MHKGAINPEAIFTLNKKLLKGILGQQEETKGEEKRDHWQCYVEFKKKVYATAVRKVFPSGQWRSEPAKAGYKENKEYCSKSASKKGPYFELGEFAVRGKSNKLVEIEGRVKEGVTERELWQEYFPTMVIHHRGICRGIQMLQTPQDVALFTQDKFPWTEEHKLDWSKTIILWGESGIGKTQWALSFFKKPLLVSEKDQLGLFDNSYDGIIFDDMSFVGDSESKKGAWSVGNQIHLVDQDNNRAIRIRYQDANIPAHTKKIITTNIDQGWVVALDEKAILRRVQVVNLKRFVF